MTQDVPCVLVTGATGFVGAHVVTQLLDGGYRVTGAARGAKVEKLRKAFSAKYGDKFSVVEIADANTGDFSGIFKGIDAVIHVGTLLRPQKGVPVEAVVEKALHILREAAKAGVKKFIYTSSIVGFPAEPPYGPDDWNPVTKETAHSNKWLEYVFERVSCERAILAFADTHPQVDVTTLSPPWVFGPLAPAFTDTAEEPDYKALSSVGFMYALLRPGNTDKDGTPPGFSGEFIDVRDLARVHVAALHAAPASLVGKKRFAVMSPIAGSMKDAIRLVARERPALKERLAHPGEDRDTPVSGGADPSLRRLEEVVRVSREGYKTWEECVLDTVDSLIAIEDIWRRRGFEVNVPEVVAMMALLDY